MSLLYFPSSSSSSGGQLILIKKQTASSDSTIDFVDGSGGVTFDSTYSTYIFQFEKVLPSASTPAVIRLEFQATIDGTNFDENISSVAWYSQSYYTEESFGGPTLSSSLSQYNSTSMQAVALNTTAIAANSGSLTVFDPASSSDYKLVESQTLGTTDASAPSHAMVQFSTAGIFMTDSALTGVRFQYNTGNIASGDITLFGLKTT